MKNYLKKWPQSGPLSCYDSELLLDDCCDFSMKLLNLVDCDSRNSGG